MQKNSPAKVLIKRLRDKKAVMYFSLKSKTTTEQSLYFLFLSCSFLFFTLASLIILLKFFFLTAYFGSLVYGTTGSGKTFTMTGTVNSPGIMVLILQDLFKARGRKFKENNLRKYKVYLGKKIKGIAQTTNKES